MRTSGCCGHGEAGHMGGARDHPFLQAQCHGDVVSLTTHALVARVVFIVSQDGNDRVGCVALGLCPSCDGLTAGGKAVTDLLAGFKHGVHVLRFACANWRLHWFGCVDVLNYGAHLNTCQSICGAHMNIGSRLKEERERISYSQEKLGAIGGVQKRAQINYEAGERLPDAAYLRGVAQVGVDIQYVLLGVRSANLMEIFVSDEFVNETRDEHVRSGSSQPDVEVQPITGDEQVLLDSYRRCKPDAKANLIQTAALLSAGIAPAAAPKARSKAVASGGVSMSMSNVGNGNVQMGPGAKVTKKDQ